LRNPQGNGAWEVRLLSNLEEAASLLKIDDDLVLGLPISSVLAQRFRLPTIDPTEFPEMVRLQIEKRLPYSAEEVTTDFEVVEQENGESIVSAVAVSNRHLAEIAAPLIDRGFIPRQVTVYASQRGSTHVPQGRALLIYPEGEALVSAITENGRVTLTRTLEGIEREKLQSDLPQLALSAELQGIPASFPNVLLDESCYELRDMVHEIVDRRPELVGTETPPATVKLNLLPESWRELRAQIARRAEWKKRLIWAAGAYAGIILLFIAYVIYARIRIAYLDRQIAHDAPQTDFIKAADAKWKALGPAIDTRYYPVEILQHLSDSLPSPEIHITAYNQSARQISIDGEATSAALAYQFAEKLKKNGELRIFEFTMSDPRILPNNHAQFRIEGRPK
jgi:hypothetical protein